MRVDILEDKSSFGVSSEEPPLHEKTPAFPGVCVSVGDIIEDYEENTLRYVEIRRMHWRFNVLYDRLLGSNCRGHGTRVSQDQLVATVCGIVERVNKLITVRSLHRRYAPEVGDIVLGRVTEVWLCTCCSYFLVMANIARTVIQPTLLTTWSEISINYFKQCRSGERGGKLTCRQSKKLISCSQLSVYLEVFKGEGQQKTNYKCERFSRRAI